MREDTFALPEYQDEEAEKENGTEQSWSDSVLYRFLLLFPKKEEIRPKGRLTD